MARRIIHKLLDDLTGGDADETVTFALDGVQYEIDLSDANAKQLRDVLAPYVSKGSKIGRAVSVGDGRRATRAAAGANGGRRGANTTDPEQNRAIRDWAKKAGKNISDRGRIPVEIVDQYHAQAGR
ncbi:Lsr2 family protein [Micromonospora sp. NPDC000663]|uniref:histone-like nucleoid-structuring protein Lsr2 n=1 Tax=Micromonospora sp. NPDC000663 TaxID=3364218 RepID=UPI0036BB3D9E